MTVKKPKRMGPQMRRAIALVEREAGPVVMKRIADQLHIGCYRGTRCSLGYDPIHRAIKAGFLALVDGKLIRTGKELP